MNCRVIIAAITLLTCAAVQAQVHNVGEMNAEQIRQLDRQKTVVILKGGILEQHGPHLPSFTDGYSNEWLAQRLAEAVVQRKGWEAVIFPTIPLGHGGANELGGKYVFPGTYAVRRTTLRAVFMDLATELGEQGFRWIFVLHGHGDPYHNLMLDQAGEYFRDTYGGHMVHLRGLSPTGEQLAKLGLKAPDLGLTDAERKENGVIDAHAGMDETSRMLFLKAGLVSGVYRTLAPLATNNPVDLTRVGKYPEWPGYLGSPRLASASLGARLQQYRSARDNALALAILDGALDERDVPRDTAPLLSIGVVKQALDDLARNDAEIEAKQRAWLKQKGME